MIKARLGGGLMAQAGLEPRLLIGSPADPLHISHPF